MSEKREKLSILQTLTLCNLKENRDKIPPLQRQVDIDMNVVSSVLKEMISEMPELVIPERKGIVDYINIEHDYYEIWERILKKLGRELLNILKETSFSQVKNTELKEDLLKM